MSRTRHHRGQRRRRGVAPASTSRAVFVTWEAWDFPEGLRARVRRLVELAGAGVDCCDDDTIRIYGPPGRRFRALCRHLDGLLGSRA